MARGPKYRISFRRRREGKTNYHRRLKLIISRRKRLVIRCSNKHTIVQVVDALVQGDKILAQSHSSQLEKQFTWVHNSGNMPSAYLTGYLCGLRAKKAKIQDIILDIGIIVHNDRIKAAFRGFIDAGNEVPHDNKWFPDKLEERLNGSHIETYAKLLKKKPAQYKKKFSKILLKKGDPLKIVSDFDKAKKNMEEKV
ncbi:50S ribosomal protein L18 [Promethearchaeum syntrophicum]|uniref:Large ribosomal subunit protein uL18 n=1 Tax=Promethearchaeum syntrophicum TaxID=2594042 RepID=A0A5B9D935_9ARCH|nr:50S ribosomal protein L18 [Candidatus Prometheoarchaeum syntrophicum]QEE15347.1 50S ribosomal protein L18P [Candidatus Prometheoarchaeum syntrophicum]